MFISLALWIGAYTLFLLIRPLSTRALATSQHPIRTALGGWLPPVALGAVQVVILLATVGLGLDLRIAHPVLALLVVLFVSATFVAILHALSARLGALAGDVAVLAAYLVAALAVSSVAARRSRVWTPSRVKPELAL